MIEYWKNKKGLFNYHIKGKNGQILAEIKQGFTRKANLIKNIKATYTALFKALSGTNGTTKTISSILVEIKAPK
jgi:uncharacterized protein YegP (UPF0339 family)